MVFYLFVTTPCNIQVVKFSNEHLISDVKVMLWFLNVRKPFSSMFFEYPSLIAL